MSKLIFVENYVFGSEWFHSIGINRIDTRTKEKRAEDLAGGIKLIPAEWPVTLQLYIRSPDDTLRVLNFQSRSGEEGTVDLFLEVIEQVEPLTMGSYDSRRGYKAFLMDDLQIQAKPGKENKNGTRQEGTDKQGVPIGGGQDGGHDGGGAGQGDIPGGSGGDSEGSVQGNAGGDLGGNEGGGSH